ncbi:MAG: response regulator [Bacteriovoracaceae bacterium]|nr:response regulator [Bacteriovoracaceae bacterium]
MLSVVGMYYADTSKTVSDTVFKAVHRHNWFWADGWHRLFIRRMQMSTEKIGSEDFEDPAISFVAAREMTKCLSSLRNINDNTELDIKNNLVKIFVISEGEAEQLIRTFKLSNRYFWLLPEIQAMMNNTTKGTLYSTNVINLIRRGKCEQNITSFQSLYKKMKVEEYGYSDASAIMSKKADKFYFFCFSLVLILIAVLVLHIIRQNHKYMQKQLIKSKEIAEAAARAKSEFLAVMSHEIRTPMNVIVGMSDILLESIQGKEQIEQLEKLQYASDTLLELIDNILDLSRIEMKKLTISSSTFDLHGLVNEVVDILQIPFSEHGLELFLKLDKNLPVFVAGDKIRLRQVLINLMSNALKYTERGSVNLYIERDKSSDGYIHFQVKDTGSGLTEYQQKIIFEKFTQVEAGLTRAYGGSGLGLTISKELVVLMAGRIWVESNVGRGSVFHFSLPLKEVSEEDKIEIAEKKFIANEDVSPQRILLVEDSVENQLLIEIFLKKSPHSLDVVSNGEDCLKKIMEQEYDLVLMDIQMPIMDGYTAVSKIRVWEMDTKRSPMKIVALTAHALEGDRKKCLDAGCDNYLAKPIKKLRLLEIINQYAGTKGTT